MFAVETALTPSTYRSSLDRSFARRDPANRFGRESLPESASCTAISRSRPKGLSIAEQTVYPSTAPGRQVGRYQLIERLGQGSQGEVWRAFPVGSEGADVALKVLPPILARDPKRHAQFRHEAERGARIEGPSLLPTFEYGECDGMLFMAMPLVEGCSLGEVIGFRRNPIADWPYERLHRLAFAGQADYLTGVVRILARVARGLAGAHSRGVVHLDVKPANILLDRYRPDDGYLCDFGLGRDLDVATPAQIRDGAGTPLYMAPERLLRHRADERLCDIFAFGATLFEALTLTPPLQVPEEMPWHDWHSHLAELRPSIPSCIQGAIPAALDAIILKSLARLPHERYLTANALADDLDRFLSGRPVLASPVMLIS